MVELRDYQQRMIDGIRDEFRQGKKRVCVLSPTGCHAKGTLIMMATGELKAVEQIVVGDLVMGPDSTPRRVQELHRGIDEMFEVIPTKGEKFVVNRGHILSLVETHTGAIKNISVGDWLRQTKTFKHTHKLYRAAVNFTKAEHNLRIHPYVMGVLLGDGSLSHGLVISNPDDEVLESICQMSNAAGLDVTMYATPDRCRTFGIHGNRQNHWLMALRDYGLGNARSGDKFIPFQYKTADYFSRLELLAGIVDTDGHLNNNGIDYISKSKILADDVAFLSRSLGLAAYVNTAIKGCNGKHGEYYRVSISGNTNIITTRVKRKKAFPRKQKKDVLRTGFSVESVGIGSYFGFECDGDHLYVMGDFTVTHNSGKTELAMAMIDSAARRGKRALFICDRVTLIEQTSRRFYAAGISHGVIQAQNENYHPWMTVQICSIQTLARRRMPDFDFAVVDEAHSQYKTQIEMFKAFPNTPFVGLSATPWARGMGKHWQTLVTGPTTQELIGMGFLAPSVVYGPPIDLSSVRIRAGEFVKDELGEAVDKPKLVADIVTTWLKRGEDRQTICFATNIAHSKHIVAEFKRCGIVAAHVDAYDDSEERRAILKAFDEGEIKILSSVDVLTKGFDSPNASCMIDALPTNSLIRHVQKVGRVIRIAPGKVNAIILDHAGNTERLGFVTDPLPTQLDMGEKRENKKRERKEPLPKHCAACDYMKPPKVHACPQCGFAPEKQSDVETQDGELVKAEAASQLTKTQWLQELLGYARERGMKDGWAAHVYREKFGHWPGPIAREPKEPSEAVRKYIQHLNIKKAKSKSKPLPSECKYCNSTNLVTGGGKGPHHASLLCGQCGRFQLWLPKESERRKESV